MACYFWLSAIQLFIAATVCGAEVSLNAAPDQRETKDFLDFLERKQYDHRARPEASSNQPTVVEISIFVGSIRAVSEVTMDYSMEIFYREYWKDKRLAGDQTLFKNKSEISLHESYAAFLWRPDTFLPNAVESVNPAEHSITHRSLLRLRPGGTILYSRRLSVKAECPMDLTLFPFDRQVCKLGIESYGYPTSEVHYKWANPDPVQLGKIKLPDFILEKVITSARNYTYETGTYSRLYCCFVFARDSGFCFMQLFIPATAVVMCSWVSLWMEQETTFQDMISVILTLTFLIYSYNTVMPRVSYIKAMDVYLGGCFFFVFFSLIKLAIVKYMRQNAQAARNASLVGGVLTGPNMDPELGNGQVPPLDHTPRLAPMRKGIFRATTAASCSYACMRRCHVLSQVLFPMTFILFCAFYFLAYTTIYASDTKMDC